MLYFRGSLKVKCLTLRADSELLSQFRELILDARSGPEIKLKQAIQEELNELINRCRKDASILNSVKKISTPVYFTTFAAIAGASYCGATLETAVTSGLVYGGYRALEELYYKYTDQKVKKAFKHQEILMRISDNYKKS